MNGRRVSGNELGRSANVYHNGGAKIRHPPFSAQAHACCCKHTLVVQPRTVARVAYSVEKVPVLVDIETLEPILGALLNSSESVNTQPSVVTKAATQPQRSVSRLTPPREFVRL